MSLSIESLPQRILLKNGTIIDPLHKTKTTGSVLIEDGKIVAAGTFDESEADEIIDCTGKVITHGFCDIHVHFREPGREDKETLGTGSRAALAGGYTRVCVMPNTTPPLDTPESIKFVVEKAEHLPLHIHPIGAVSKGQQGKEITEMGAMADEGAVAFSDDGLPISDGQVMRHALEYARMLDVPIINHAEDVALRQSGMMNEGTMSTRLGLSGNPTAAEATMIKRDVDLSTMLESKLHVPHVSTAQGVGYIVEHKAQNRFLTLEVTPHHLYFNDAALRNYDTNLKVAPPLRSEADRQALIEAVLAGHIDCIATDHAPHTIEEKEQTFDQVPFGLIGLESAFGAVNKVLCYQAKLLLENLLPLLTVNPRKIMGFPVDLFAEGTEAEITVLDPDAEWEFSTTDLAGRSKNCPYVGETLRGKVELTISRKFLAR